MDIFEGSPTADLRAIAGRSAAERMEVAYKQAAMAELASRAALSSELLRRRLAKAERHHRARYAKTGDSNPLRWANQLAAELEALGV